MIAFLISTLFGQDNISVEPLLKNIYSKPCG